MATKFEPTSVPLEFTNGVEEVVMAPRSSLFGHILHSFEETMPIDKFKFEQEVGGELTLISLNVSVSELDVPAAYEA